MTTNNSHMDDDPLDRHWDRFDAWCVAWSRQSLPADPATVEEFLQCFPASASTQRLRRQAIRHRHIAAGHTDPTPPPDAQRVLSVGQDQVEQILASIPKFRFPVGVRGRRDAFLVVLLGALQLSRGEARAIGSADIDLDGSMRVAGVEVPVAADPSRCAACAVTRWLRLVGSVWSGFRGDVLGLVDPTRGTLAAHDCRVPVVGEWRRAEQLLLPLDTHGWARTGAALSARSISAIAPRRRDHAADDLPVEHVGPITRAPSRFDALTSQEAYAALGEADAAVDAVLERLATLSAALSDLDGELPSATHEAG
jgi:hypothetical protein